MSGRVTRRSAAHEAAFLAPIKDEPATVPSSPPATPQPTKANGASKSSSKSTKSKTVKPTIKKEPIAKALPTPTSTSVSSPIEDEGQNRAKSSPTKSSKRKRAVKEEAQSDVEEAPHNMGALKEELSQAGSDFDDATSAKKPMKKSTSNKSKSTKSTPTPAQLKKDQADAERSIEQLAKVKARYEAEVAKREKAIEAGINKKTKSDTYGLSEGETPFPRWEHPTSEECHEVYKILHKAHPECRPQPKTVPEPSEFVAGCGEVRSILDALIRTRLSATTTSRNSNAAYQGMVARYGLNKTGVGKGSVDYNAIRKAGVQELFHAIKVGGLGVNKSADIMTILDITYAENQARREELLAAKTDKKNRGPKGAEVENEEQKDAEVKLAEDGNLSMDHYYTLPTYAAIYKFMTLPGIGVKTAACVAMFCMQRPCFAVDTHVFRLAKWLGWVPPPEEKQKGEKGVDRDTTFSHLEVRVPDELKYMLHQLLIKHGKTCGRCGGITSEGSAKWAKGCPIEELVDRGEGKKGGSPKKKSGGGKAKVDQIDEEDESESESESEEEVVQEDDSSDDEMPDLHSDASEDEASESEEEAPPPKKIRGPAPPIKDETMDLKEEAAAPLSAKKRGARAAKKESALKQHGVLKEEKKVKGVPRNGWRGGRHVSSSREGSSDL